MARESVDVELNNILDRLKRKGYRLSDVNLTKNRLINKQNKLLPLFLI